MGRANLMLVLFCSLVALVASALAIVEVLGSSRDAWEALWTKETLGLILINLGFAWLLAFVLETTTGQFGLGVVSGAAIVFGYPLLLHTKVFHVGDISYGLEEGYQRISNLLLPGINHSVDERGGYYLTEFRETMSTAELVPPTKIYLTIKQGEREVPAERANELLTLMDRLLMDSRDNPQNQADNNQTIYITLYETGKYRAVRHIRKRVRRGRRRG